MDVADLLRRLLRRRLAVVAVVLVAVVAAGVSWVTAGSSQQSGAALVIVPPTLGSAVSEQNPLLNLDNNLAQLATVLSAAMNSASAAQALQRQDATASFTIATETGTNPSFAQLSPQLVFTVTGADASEVERTSTVLVSVARQQLSALQAEADVPRRARATLVQVVAPTTSEAVGGGRLRSAGTIGLAIIVLGLLLVLLGDELRTRRTRRRTPPARRPTTRRRRRVEDLATSDPDSPSLRSR